ncbi:MAG TPA: hypothetical protein VMZ50_01105 [Phycisphaerae bacterium]|nr:hypothetical protein [Phycisphaerae bacterium]
MLTVEQAVARIKEVEETYARTRAGWDAFWTMGVAYDGGSQWNYQTTEHGRNVINRLRNVIDPAREDVRVTMNLVHQAVVRKMGLLQPQKVACYAQARPGRPQNRMAADIGDRLLRSFLDRGDGLAILREKDRHRCVLGTAIVRRTLSARAMRAVAEGQVLRDWDYGWAHVYPWEIIRDPSATTCRPERDEEIWIQCKPRSVEWIKRHWGVDVTTTTTIGELSDYQKQIFAAHGMTAGGAADSKVKGVLAYEAYFKDAEDMGEGGGSWAWGLLGWRDPNRDGERVKPILFGRNAFHGLPYEVFTDDEYTQAMWGVGEPHLSMPAQDMVNIAWTWLLRVQQAGAGKVVFERGSVENQERAFDNNVMKPLEWIRTPGGVAPTRMAPPQVSSVTPQIIAAGPVWLDKMLNLSDVQYGITSKRGESGEAVEAKLGAANMPIDQKRTDDRAQYERLLYGTLMDMTHPDRMRVDGAQAMLGPDVPRDQILVAMRVPFQESVASVVVHSSTVNPQTRAEVKEETSALHAAKLIDTRTAHWRLADHGIMLDPAMGDSKRKQDFEILMMMEGRDVDPANGDNDDYHIFVLRRFIDSPRWHDAEEDARDRILRHLALHQANQLQMAQLFGAPQGPSGAPSPPASAVEALTGRAGAAAPEARVA